MALGPGSHGQAGSKPWHNEQDATQDVVGLGRAQWDTGNAKEACRCKQEAGLDSLQLLEVTQRLSGHSLGPPCSWSGAEPALERQTHKARCL